MTIDLNEYREQRDGKAWIHRLVSDTNALSARIREADEAGMPLPSKAAIQLSTSLVIALRSVVRMEMRGQGGASWRGRL